MQWQRDQIIALAPDAASAKAAQELTTPRKWVTLGVGETALWGECQGSGAKPYQTAIDLSEPAFKCSCPSRKFPCKHGLALFLLYSQSADTFAKATAAPPWVQSWLDGRTKRQTAKAENANSAAAARPDEAAQAKRTAARSEKVAAGITELTIWLKDLVRTGFAEAQSQPYSFWQTMAARLIDAQAPGLAAQVQTLGQLVASGEGWAGRLTEAIGKLFLLLAAYQRLDALPPALQQDVRTLIGWYQPREEVMSGEPVQGRWQVLSVSLEKEEALFSQRVWLRQTTGNQYALILNFAHESNRQSLEAFWSCGAEVEATLYYYASSTPLRAVATAVKTVAPIQQMTGALPIADALTCYRQAVAQNPWLTRYPLLLADVAVHYTQQPNGKTAWFLGQEQSALLPLSRHTKNQWLLLSITGGAPALCFGEWLEDGFLPLGVWSAERYWSL
ncbi:MAG: SWIM zinc finger family protein [Caldilinea sp. CFX5]|nr:SWIM zinc finger family protein [Caldilinea sp. CFX5]